jgi:hypothetical protein
MLTMSVLNADQLQAVLGRDLTAELQSLTSYIAEEVQHLLAPYPPSTVANAPVYNFGPHTKPANYGRWYERGYGPHWSRKDGSIGGSKTSEMMDRRWGISVPMASRTSALLSNSASYAKYLHSADEQVGWAVERDWKTDKWAIERVQESGLVERAAADMLRKVFGS